MALGGSDCGYRASLIGPSDCLHSVSGRLPTIRRRGGGSGPQMTGQCNPPRRRAERRRAATVVLTRLAPVQAPLPPTSLRALPFSGHPPSFLLITFLASRLFILLFQSPLSNEGKHPSSTHPHSEHTHIPPLPTSIVVTPYLLCDLHPASAVAIYSRTRLTPPRFRFQTLQTKMLTAKQQCLSVPLLSSATSRPAVPSWSPVLWARP